MIDVGPTDLKQDPRLWVTNGEKGSWAALSYCWGGSSSFVLKSTNIGKFCTTGFPMTSFPATLIDAVHITRALNIRYLWIDALCILQDSPEDWAKESARMKDVYGGAVLTIAATSANSAEVGMLRKRFIPVEACRIEWRSRNSTSNSKVFLRSGSSFWNTSMRDQAINQRGWTLQENLLSPRMISYGSQEMAWECQERRVSESGRPILAGEHHRDKSFIQSLLMNRPSVVKRTTQFVTKLSTHFIPYSWSFVLYHNEGIYDQIYSRWFAIVTEFSRRDLTVQSDVLPALSGIAAIFQKLLHDRYCAGLWCNAMIRGLVWSRTRRKRVHPQGSRVHASISTLANYHIPSWSWASITGGLIMFGLGGEVSWSSEWIEEAAQVLDCRTIARTTDPFGQTSEGHLVLKAPFLQIIDPRSKNLDPCDIVFPALHERIQIEMSLQDFQAEFKQHHKSHTGQNFALIRLVKSYEKIQDVFGTWSRRENGTSVLMLESTGEQQMEYRRVGLLAIRPSGLSSPDEINWRCLNEMKKAKWDWKKVRLV